ncbi:3-oxoacid CoA-transferase subunit B [Halobacteriovorax sp. XZX-3]|uniref:3-oxoacid CoA-transferase subunit B n=1 Tax=unclassified Halobacteriovorax TaxID=2639665 RepID=UPI000CD15C4C|nr:3-oxoacid CoA-transferase subunit B [Halobacteriovorax sp. DA5]POB14176.1 succinyl-CoA--3-ketoacid-CoA transferase [Halobacteriovorax sp. DA5]
MWTKEQMAKEVTTLFTENSTINLGIGLPTIIPSQLPKNHSYIIHSENGVLGVGDNPTEAEVSATLINAGKETITVEKGASFFDSSMSFGMIRGGHIDFCVLGGMEVDTQGSLANWKIPGKKITGMGGAMDLVNGAKNIIVMMSHYSKTGEPKLLPECTLPLTGKSVVNYVVTECGSFKIEDGKFKVLNMANGLTIKELNKNFDNEIFE